MAKEKYIRRVDRPLLCCSNCGCEFIGGDSQWYASRGGSRVYCTSDCQSAGVSESCKKHTALERFLSQVDKNGPIPEKCPERGPCWMWNAFRREYGRMNDDDGRCCLAHRWAYEHFRQPVPPGLDLHHACETQACCNPWHLDAITRREHILRHPNIQAAAVAYSSSITHCPAGHEYTPENTNIGKRKNGGTFRQCRICQKVRDVEFRLRRRALKIDLLVTTHKDIGQSTSVNVLDASGNFAG